MSSNEQHAFGSCGICGESHATDRIWVVENTDGKFVASFSTHLLAHFFVEDGNGCYRYRTPTDQVEADGDKALMRDAAAGECGWCRDFPNSERCDCPTPVEELEKGAAIDAILEECFEPTGYGIPRANVVAARNRILAALAATNAGQVEAETWESINQWCDDTFGPATVPQIIARAKEEFDELEEPGANHAIEAADVVICLCRIPGFAEALQEKMAINRKRKWRLTGDGTGYHIPEAALTNRVQS